MFHNIVELLSPELAKFLRDNDALKAFIDNCPNKVGELDESYLVGIDSIMGCPFTYYDSPEGKDYWMDLSNRFEATLSTPTFPDKCMFDKSFNEVFGK